MHEVTIHNITPEHFAKVKDAVLGPFEGKAVGANEVDVQGARATYTYDPKAKSLTVGLLSTPALVTKGYALGQLYDAIGRLG